MADALGYDASSPSGGDTGRNDSTASAYTVRAVMTTVPRTTQTPTVLTSRPKARYRPQYTSSGSTHATTKLATASTQAFWSDDRVRYRRRTRARTVGPRAARRRPRPASSPAGTSSEGLP